MKQSLVCTFCRNGFTGTHLDIEPETKEAVCTECLGRCVYCREVMKPGEKLANSFTHQKCKDTARENKRDHEADEDVHRQADVSERYSRAARSVITGRPYPIDAAQSDDNEDE